jgi:hypothetical protein
VNVIARVSTGAESISNKLDPAGQRQIEQRLVELARRSRSWEREVDRVAGQIAQPGRNEAFGSAMARAGDDAERLRRRIEGSRGSIRESLARPLNMPKQQPSLSGSRSRTRGVGKGSWRRMRVKLLRACARFASRSGRSATPPARSTGRACDRPSCLIMIRGRKIGDSKPETTQARPEIPAGRERIRLPIGARVGVGLHPRLGSADMPSKKSKRLSPSR